jgi:hypothetical protein
MIKSPTNVVPTHTHTKIESGRELGFETKTPVGTANERSSDILVMEEISICSPEDETNPPSRLPASCSLIGVTLAH